MDFLKHKSHLDESFQPNNIYKFIPADSEARFKNNIKNGGRNISTLYYIENPIEYSLNNCGFRSPDDFNSEEEGNVFLGCSHTFGIGHHLENTWAYKVNQKIGGKFWNLGAAGTGVPTHFRFLFAYYKELKIKNIFHYAPRYPRYEFIENGLPQHYIISDYNKNWDSKFGSLMLDSLLTDEQCQMNWYISTYAIRGLASEIGCNYYLIDEQPPWRNAHSDGSLQARDLFHHSTKTHHEIYEEAINMCDSSLLDNEEIKNPIFDIENHMKSKKTSLL